MKRRCLYERASYSGTYGYYTRKDQTDGGCEYRGRQPDHCTQRNLDGTTIIPVSKIVYGFASGGSEFANKQQPSANLFGGGGGAGVTINPVAFIAITHGDVKLLNISNGSNEKAIALVPEMFDKIVSLIKKDKSKDDKKEDAEEGITDPEV